MPEYIVDCSIYENYQYEYDAKKFIQSSFSNDMQRKAIKAIDDLFKLKYKEWFNEDTELIWRWICTALKKKNPSNWATHGFGLLFNKNFKGCVFEEMKREDESRGESLDEFYCDSDLIENVESD